MWENFAPWILLALLLLSVGNLSGYARGVIVDWLPFLGVLIAYDLLRGAADGLLFAPYTFPQMRADEALFGGTAPSVWLQRALFDPDHLHFWDYGAWAVYMTHFFVIPIAAILLWRFARPRFRRFAVLVGVLCLAAFATYALYPAVPPWMASRQIHDPGPVLLAKMLTRDAAGVGAAETSGGGVAQRAADSAARRRAAIELARLRRDGRLDRDVGRRLVAAGLRPEADLEPTTRVIGLVWGRVGGASYFATGARYANPVAAVPSLHAAFPFLLLLFFWGAGWWVRGLLALYTLAMGFALVYGAEHYAIDIFLGWAYAAAVFFGVNALLNLRTARRESSGPGHDSRIASSPPRLSTSASTTATRIASSSWPATGMKSGTRSTGSAR